MELAQGSASVKIRESKYLRLMNEHVQVCHIYLHDFVPV